MSDIVLTSDHYILLSATLVIGITIIYAIKKWLSTPYRTPKITPKESIDSSSDVCDHDLNDNHKPNGKAIKVTENHVPNVSKKTHKSVNNNDSEESEVCEEFTISESTVKPLIKSFEISDNYIKVDFESNESIDKNCVNELTVESKCEDLLEAEVNQIVENVSNLAAIILTDEHRKDWYEIVCITSGNDIIDAQHLEPEFVVIDCRAPVLARRGLIRYLYRKLIELVTREVTEKESLFTTIPASNRFEVKKHFKFNLYLSEPPDSWVDRSHMGNGSAIGSKIVKLKSTTDKISVWNQVGVQGSLLSHFLDTIYIDSVVTGGPLNERSFHQHFVLNYTKEPKLLKCENFLIKDIMNRIHEMGVNGRHYQQKLATNWIHGEEGLEFIDCRTGKAVDMSPDCRQEVSVSRLSKHDLHKCFRHFLTHYEHNLRPNQSLPMTYRKWKESAPNYRIQKQLLKVRYAVAGRQWTTLSSHLDHFI